MGVPFVLVVACQFKEFFMVGNIKCIEQFFDCIKLLGKFTNDIGADTYLKGGGDTLAFKTVAYCRHIENRVSGKCNFLPLCYVGFDFLVAIDFFHMCIS